MYGNVLSTKSLPDVLSFHAATQGDVIAVRCGGRFLTYRGLQERSELAARALVGLGLKTGQRVAFLAKTCVEYFEFIVGCMKTGLVPVPVNWRLATPEIVAVLADAEALLLVVGDEFVERVKDLEGRLPNLRRILALQAHAEYELWDTFLKRCNQSERLSHALLTDTVVMQIYTSGTTGKPKGVMTSNAGLTSYLQSLGAVARFRVGAVSLSTLPLFHIGGTGWALAGLYCGSTVVLLREANPELVLEAIETFQITNLIAVPSVVQTLLNSPHLQQTACGSLRYLYYGGGPMTEALLRRALDAFDCNFIQGFGMTECPLISVLQPEEHEHTLELLRSCGRAIPGTSIRLVDPETLNDVPQGAVGEIWVQSPQLLSGYWKQPALTQQNIVDGRWLRTGDAGYQDSKGFLFLKDRIKDMIVSGGENIYPAEVENVLVGHPHVRECAVIGVPSPKWIETVKAIVVPASETHLPAEELIAFCKRNLAGYKCPTSVEFVESLPRTPSGKIIKQELRNRYSRPD